MPTILNNRPFNPRPLHPRAVNLTGRITGRLQVICLHSSDDKNVYWLCLCSCGTWKISAHANLRRNVNPPLSCGCLWKESQRKAVRSHGATNTPEYRAYAGAKYRCLSPTHPAYKWYGSRGIEFRFTSFEEFLAEIGQRPQGLSLERIDNNGHYEKGNVKWATKTDQSRNRRNINIITWKGISRTIVEWASITGVNPNTLKSRLTTYGWSVDKALSFPVDSRKASSNKRQVRGTGAAFRL